MEVNAPYMEDTLEDKAKQMEYAGNFVLCVLNFLNNPKTPFLML